MRSKIHFVLIAGSAAWLSAIVMAPILHLQFVYQFFSIICHQDPLRSWTLASSPLPVCIRCVSIYAGFFIAVLFSLHENSRNLGIAVIASLLEAILERVGLDSPWLRAFTGVAVGATVAPFVRIGVEEMVRTRFRRRRQGALRDAM